MRSEKDLIDIGIKLLPARSLYHCIQEWKTNGLPVDWDCKSSLSQVEHAGSKTVTTAAASIVERRAATYKVYYKARFCGDEEAARNMQQLGESGDQLAQAYLGVLYALGCNGIVKDPAKADQYVTDSVDFLRSKADQGCPYSQHLYGLILAYGITVAKDDQEAVKYYGLAADQGHANAQTALGLCFASGTGVAKNQQKAVHHYKLAAKQGHALAQCSLAWFYANGKTVRKNVRKAAMYLKMAADQGYADAQCNLAVCYVNGCGVAKNELEAVRYSQLAADQGHTIAQNNLGCFYAAGMGVTKDEQEAVRYYKMAADQGYAAAQYNLATCLHNGAGVAKDEVQAAMYFELAAKQESTADAHDNRYQNTVQCSDCWAYGLPLSRVLAWFALVGDRVASTSA